MPFDISKLSAPPNQFDLAGLTLAVRQMAVVTQAALQTISEASGVDLSQTGAELKQIDQDLDQLFVSMTGWTEA